MSNFGSINSQDYFGILGTTIDGLAGSARCTIVASNKTPIELSRVNALDECGDIIASRFIGNTTQNMAEVSVTYLCKNAGNFISWRNALALGDRIVAGVNTCVTSCEIVTNNSDLPRVTLTGRINHIYPTTARQYLPFPALNWAVGSRACAYPVGFTVTKGRLTSCSLSSSINMQQYDDGIGEPYAHHTTSGEGTITAEFVRTSATAGDEPAWSVSTGSGLTETQKPTYDAQQASFNTSSATISFTLSAI